MQKSSSASRPAQEEGVLLESTRSSFLFFKELSRTKLSVDGFHPTFFLFGNLLE